MQSFVYLLAKNNLCLLKFFVLGSGLSGSPGPQGPPGPSGSISVSDIIALLQSKCFMIHSASMSRSYIMVTVHPVFITVL